MPRSGAAAVGWAGRGQRGQVSPPRLSLQWHALSREEQAKYYELARKERQLHMQLYPGWSARDNYVSGFRGSDPLPMAWPETSRLSLVMPVLTAREL